MMRAEIHPNVHMVKAGETACISLKEMKKYARTRLVATAILSDVEFVVHDSGRTRAVEEQTKNVHAWARGNLVGEFDNRIELSECEIPDSIKKRFREVSYNYDIGHFYDVETYRNIRSNAKLVKGIPDYTAALVKSAKTVYAVGDKFYYLPSK